jgi:chromosome segregation ATPase
MSYPYGFVNTLYGCNYCSLNPSALRDDIDTLKKTIETLKAELRKNPPGIAVSYASYNTAAEPSGVENVVAQVEQAQEKMVDNTMTLVSDMQKVQARLEACDATEKELHEVKQALDGAENHIKELEPQLAELASFDQVRQELDQVKQAHDGAVAHIAEVEAEVARVTAAHNETGASLDAAAKEVDALRAQLAAVANEQAALQDAQAHVQGLEADVAALKSVLKSIHEQSTIEEPQPPVEAAAAAYYRY